MLQRSMAGDVLAEALTGRLYPDELQARLRPFGIGERAAVLAFAPPDPRGGRRWWNGSSRARTCSASRPETARAAAGGWAASWRSAPGCCAR